METTWRHLWMIPYFTLYLVELVDVVWEGDELGGTDEREVQRVEENDNIFAAIVLKKIIG